jgi:RNA-splicing ligase RtcB
MFEIKGKHTTAKVFAEKLDGNCIGQITELTNHPAFTEPISIMPDAHYGAGAVIGFTMPLTDKVIPNVIGMDIGCGMLFADLGPGALYGPLKDIDEYLRKAIPFGMRVHNRPTMGDLPVYKFWEYANRYWMIFQRAQADRGHKASMPPYDPQWFAERVKVIGCDPQRAHNSIGTLGGGNHFIEFCKDEKDNHIWLVIHSGSRNFGKTLCTYWQRKAVAYHKERRKSVKREEINRLKAQKATMEINKRIVELESEFPLPPKGLEWLETPDDRFGYMHDMLFAQQYAAYNRLHMFHHICEGLKIPKGTVYYECVHNFIDPADMIIRKGAIRADEGTLCLVPLHMAAGCLLGSGIGNEEWNYSAPHGAGRAMSRTEAKATIKLKDFTQQMKEAGVWSSSVCKATIEEAPAAYKDWRTIFNQVGETMEIVSHLKPILNLKSKH